MATYRFHTLLSLLAGCISLAGCAIDIGSHGSVEPGPIVRESRSVELGKVEMANVVIKMSAGELRLSGGSAKLADADFEYNHAFLKPAVDYNSSGFRGRLTIEQSQSGLMIGNVHNIWTVRLNEKTPLDVAIHLGAGQSKLDFGTLNLRGLEVHMGAGEMKLDLTGGNFQHDFEVQVHGGVGNAVVRVPRNAGVIADVHGGIGNISASGLEERDKHTYVNRAYNSAKAKIRMSIHGGIGNVQLETE